MRSTINVKKLSKEEISFFKSQPKIYAPNLQISSKSISFLRELCEEFARNLIVESLKEPAINSRLLPIHINKVLDKRLNLELADKLIPKAKNYLK